MGWKDSKKQRSREAEGLVTELWSQRIVTIYWLCCQLCYETVANQRTSVEIELLATMSWTCGCQPLSCPCSQNVMHGQKEICPAWWTCLSKVPIPTRSLRPLSLQKIESRHPRFGLQDIDCDLSCLIDATAASQWRIVEIHLLASAGWKRGCEPFGCRCSQHVTTCLFHESIPAIPFWNSKHSLPLWEPQHAPPALHYCIIPKFVFTINWLCSSVTTADTAFSLRGLEAGLWAFRPPMFTTCDDMLFRNPFPLFLFWIPSMFQEFIPAIPFWISKHPIIPIPTRSLRLLRATAPFLSSALWLHHAHPFVAATEKSPLMQRSKGFGHGVVLSKISYVQYSDCVQDLDYRTLMVLSVVTRGCCKPMKFSEQLSRLTRLRF